MTAYNFTKYLQIDTENMSAEDVKVEITYNYDKGQKGGFTEEPLSSTIEIESIELVEDLIPDHGKAEDWEQEVDMDEVETYCWEDYESRNTEDFGD